LKNKISYPSKVVVIITKYIPFNLKNVKDTYMLLLPKDRRLQIKAMPRLKASSLSVWKITQEFILYWNAVICSLLNQIVDLIMLSTT